MFQRINSSEKRELYAALETRYAIQRGALGAALQMGDVTSTRRASISRHSRFRSPAQHAERSASQADYSLRTLLGSRAG